MDDRKFRVGIYLRLSQEDKIKKYSDYSESIKNQKLMLNDYIKSHNNFILYDEYCDEDLSGAGTYRPEFERLIKDCENGCIDIVLCKSQSRFSRDMEIVEKYINNKFKEWNIRFISLSDNADTEVMGNKKSRQINGLVNEWFLEDVSNNIRSAFNSKMKEGEFISPFAPFGYEVSSIDNNKLIVDQYASNIVIDIFNLYLKGISIMGIVKYLNERNIPSPSLYKYRKGIKLNVVSNKSREDIKWSYNAVKNILTNEIYIGHLVQGKRTTVSYKNHKIINKSRESWIKIKNTHEAIIDEDAFNKVQNMLNERKRTIKTGIVHTFSGKVFCSVCNSLMKKKNSSKHEYLICSKSNCVNRKSIRYDVLEKIVIESINKMLDKYYDIDLLEKKFDNYSFYKKRKDLNKRKSYIEEKINKNEYYIKKLYEDKINGLLSEEIFINFMNRYDDEKNILNYQLELIKKEIDSLESVDIKSILECYKKLDSINRVIIEEFIKKIYVGKLDSEYKYRNILIKWNI